MSKPKRVPAQWRNTVRDHVLATSGYLCRTPRIPPASSLGNKLGYGLLMLGVGYILGSIR